MEKSFGSESTWGLPFSDQERDNPAFQSTLHWAALIAQLKSSAKKVKSVLSRTNLLSLEYPLGRTKKKKVDMCKTSQTFVFQSKLNILKNGVHLEGVRVTCCAWTYTPQQHVLKSTCWCRRP